MRKKVSTLILLTFFLQIMMIPVVKCETTYTDSQNDVYQANQLGYYQGGWTPIDIDYIDLTSIVIDENDVEINVKSGLTSIESDDYIIFLIYLNQSESEFQSIMIRHQEGVWTYIIIHIIDASGDELPIMDSGTPTITDNKISFTSTITFIEPSESNINGYAYHYVTISPLDVYIDFYPNSFYLQEGSNGDNGDNGDGNTGSSTAIWISVIALLIGGSAIAIILILRNRSCKREKNMNKPRCSIK